MKLRGEVEDNIFKRFLEVVAYIDNYRAKTGYKCSVNEAYKLQRIKKRNNPMYRPPGALIDAFYKEGINSSEDLPLLLDGNDTISKVARKFLIEEGHDILGRSSNAN